jgi:hypothetical protein
MTFTSGVSEDDLQKQVAEYLSVTLPSGCVFHHSPNEGRRHINFINKLKRMGTKYGWPDLEIFCPGSATKSGMNEAIFIELKVKRGTMNENQRRMRDAIIDAGFAWALCRSLSDVDAFLDPLIKLKVSR